MNKVDGRFLNLFSGDLAYSRSQDQRCDASPDQSPSHRPRNLTSSIFGFFGYISLFTFSMLMLVMSNNFLQLFFGWEAVGLVSYLLIGFWFKKPTAIFANMKAFLVNRVGDFGFILGIGLVLAYTGLLGTLLAGVELISPGTISGLLDDASQGSAAYGILVSAAFGASAPFLPASAGDTPLSFDAMAKAGSMLGSGAVIDGFVFDKRPNNVYKANGDLDLVYMEAVCREIGAALRDKASRHTVVVRSTVL